ncbi:MAG: hypothetical protein KC912_09850 [Proteobacteria bacterium]|nr:hypothetical protein [Pseudomonadota bacterium]
MWRTLLPDLILSGAFRTQSELVRALDQQGHPVTQATVSRELKALGVTKVDGVYALASSDDIGAPIRSMNLAPHASLCILKTDPAHASVLAQFVDGMDLDGVFGTIAGDDTVFVALRDAGAGERLTRALRRR